MKRLALFSLLVCALAAPAFAEDDHLAYSKLHLRSLEESVAKAKDHPDDPRWWAQCDGDFKSLVAEVAKLPADQRAPFDKRIKEFRPEVEAGALAGRGASLARYIRDGLESARKDLEDGPVSDRTMDKLARDFGHEDIKGIPAEELKKYQTEYADVKKRDAIATEKAKAAQK